MSATLLRAHDLLHVEPRKEWFDFEAAEDAMTELQRMPLVVVRRDRTRDGRVPVGVRGVDRSARYAGWMDRRALLRVDRAEDLLARRTAQTSAAIEALWQLADRWRAFAWPWGPAGSVGFALASGTPATSAASDLDIVIRFSQPITPQEARALLDSCAGLPARVDAQGETHLGGFSLAEFARGGACLLKTDFGPRIVNCPWREEMR